MEYYPLEQCTERTNDYYWHVVNKAVFDSRQNFIGLHFSCDCQETVHKLLIHNVRSPLSCFKYMFM